MSALARGIATVAGIGYLRPAPGTWGSLAALPLGWAVAVLFGPLGFVGATLVAFAIGRWATGVMTASGGDHDPSEIVIDEVAGQWVALMPVIWGAATVGASYMALWPGWFAAFALFRLFDILKPGPVGWFDRQHTPTGVMLDDIAAGVLAALGVIAMTGVAHWLMV